jgi:hypothetical protein
MVFSMLRSRNLYLKHSVFEVKGLEVAIEFRWHRMSKAIEFYIS